MYPKNAAQRDDSLNNRLNYGYAITRSLVARAICASGFHPAFGVHHHSKRNPFYLADDLMEPFRSLADRFVMAQKMRAKMHRKRLTKYLTKEAKLELIQPLTGCFNVDGEHRKLADVITMTVQSPVKFYTRQTEKLYLPEIDIFVIEFLFASGFAPACFVPDLMIK